MRAGRAFLDKMIERVFASMVRGPALNCRPHHSRQRLDLARLGVLEGSGGGGTDLLAALFRDRHVELSVMHRPPDAAPDDEAGLALARRWAAQDEVYRKLRLIAEDASTWERDTGASSLFVGLPLLSMPGAKRGGAGRILAPVGLVPVRLVVRTGRKPAIRIETTGEDRELVVPNAPLMAWIERETRAALPEFDSAELDPWTELGEVLAGVARALELELPAFDPTTALTPVPRSDDKAAPVGLLPCAVLGLFPTAGQTILRDLEALRDGPELGGPVRAFLDVQATLAPGTPEAAAGAPDAHDRLVAEADPCQAGAVRRARRARGLVVHGPPGTGKSQTITNVVGDHLARGERVLIVCDKRTALDVVQTRLTTLGLGGLVAVVHDVTRDRLDLYRDLREQLDALDEQQTDPEAVPRLATVDAELDTLYAELAANDALLSDGGSRSFHQLVGEWLALPEPDPAVAALDVGDTTLDELQAAQLALREVVDRAASAGWAHNPWPAAVGPSLETWLGAAPDTWEAPVVHAARAAADLDSTRHPNLAPFPEGAAPAAVADARRQLGDALDAARAQLGPEGLRALAAHQPADVAGRLAALPSHLAALAQPLDPELVLSEREAPVDPKVVPTQLAVLDSWLAVARAWYGFLFFWRTGPARLVLAQRGLALVPDAAERLRAFLLGARSRRLVRHTFAELGLAPGDDDAALRRTAAGLAAWSTAHTLLARPELADLAARARAAFAAADGLDAVIDGCARAPARAAALDAWSATLARAPLWSAAARQALAADARRGAELQPRVEAFRAALPSVEGVVRALARLSSLRAPLRDAARAVVDADLEPGAALAALRRLVLATTLRERLRQSPTLAGIDAGRVEACFSRIAALEEEKRGLVRAVVRHRWVGRQRERLLAGTGSRLNQAGAALRRRLALRGDKAMRLRQCLEAGATEGGNDPIYDLKPVWMASPETVATLFPRTPLFDIVIFDEASQCRLEEAIGVLARGSRVLIAGDPQQLPPTRFFETAQVASDAEEPEDDQALFETQQADLEDLLSAALNLEIEQRFLDVHYRSTNADLIGFSNQHYYARRLQAVPGHPSRRATVAPITLHEVGGTYHDRRNEKEAAAIVALVQELLAQDAPPSLGIACFNLVQRDTIVEALDAAAAADPAFAARLQAAQARQGRGAFEGLFVKNLENVQGDERDHILVSTTYGPAANGKFYRRFGPLGQPGGGRRLNVLVTRARDRIHLITSIPREQWASLPPVPDGQTPGGGWLLFAYLRYAAELATHYAAGPAAPAGPGADTIGARDTRSPSRLAEAVARRVHDRTRLGSTLYWGNDGFCVDVALRHPDDPGGVSVGVLLDGTRYDKATDRVEWDLFRTAVLRATGWELVRLWSPALFREPDRALQAVAARIVQPAVN